jgi:AAA domain-containing protein/uncharacterized protein DUF4145
VIAKEYGQQLLTDLEQEAFGGAKLEHRVGDLRKLLERLLDELLLLEPDYPTDLFQQITFLEERLKVPPQVVSYMHGVRKLGNRAAHAGKPPRGAAPQPDGPLTEADFRAGVRAIAAVITHFSGVAPSARLQTFYASALDLAARRASPRSQPEIVPSLRLFVTKVKSEPRTTPSGGTYTAYSLIGETEEYGHTTIQLWDKFSMVGKLAWQFCTVKCTDLNKAPNRDSLFNTTPKSLVILEPDYLVNATDIAKTYAASLQGSPEVAYLADKFALPETTRAMLLGTLANGCIDELVVDPDQPGNAIFPRLLRDNPRSMLGVLGNGDSISDLREQLNEQGKTMRRCITDAKRRGAEFTVEPTFLSETYGIQGRLDLLLEYERQPGRRDVIELKSGRPVSSEMTLRGASQGVREEHYAQAACYNLLLRDVTPPRNGDTSILYSPDDTQPLRPIDENLAHYQDILLVRNQIVALEYQLKGRYEHARQQLAAGDTSGLPPWTVGPAQALQTQLASVSTLHRSYFMAMMSFIAGEHWIAKLGTHPQRGATGLASMWRLDIAEKRKREMIISGLEYVGRESQDTSKIILGRDTDNAETSNFRPGDIAVLYPLELDGTSSPTQHQVLKCILVEARPDEVVVKLMSRQVSPTYFEGLKDRQWALEHDVLDNTFNRMYESLTLFLRASAPKRELLLGERKPRFGSQRPVTGPADGLTPRQREHVGRALSAQDYYLLQGPPGTGKTSRVIRELVRNLLADPSESILLLAFTNRAADEICKAIADLDSEVGFIRLGHNTETKYSRWTLSSIVGRATAPSEVRSAIANNRVFVSTVHSYLGTPDLWRLKRFTTAIVDEASQLLDPHLVGPLSQVERFILIGDHKQLPAVVTQPEKVTALDSKRPHDQALVSAGFWDLRVSLFERLWEQCHANRWDADACGMLHEQGRMHVQVQNFPSQRFYEGKLKALRPEQEGDTRFFHPLPIHVPDDVRPLLDLLTRRRVVFIPTPPTQNGESGHSRGEFASGIEARRVATIVEALTQLYASELDGSKIGIITPWRAQVAAIRHELEQIYAGRNVRDAIVVDTVERYQGSEREVIIISFSINGLSQLARMVDLRRPRGTGIADSKSSHQPTGIAKVAAAIGFGKRQTTTGNGVGSVDRKLNVALTRAKEQLIVLGRPDLLVQAEGQHFKALLDHITQSGYVFSPQDCELLGPKSAVLLD